MTGKVYYYIMQPVHSRPPCIMEICAMRDLGLDVEVLTLDCSDEMRKILEEKGVIIHTYSPLRHPVKLIQKAMNYLNYKKVYGDFLRDCSKTNAFLWIGTEQSAIKFWPFHKKSYPIVVNCLEFYEHEWYQKAMSKISHQADILTACEPHRAQYMVDWWKLPRMPYIIRNKPYHHPRLRYCEGSIPATREAIEKIRGKKNIMYQGAINADRDLSFLAKALKASDSDYYLVLSGRNEHESVEKLTAIYPKTIFLGNIPAPYHLEITAHASVCVAFYADNCINNRYCAPNKIYEYAGCGVPMLCNNIPGLTDTIGKAKAGECIDFHDEKAIIDAIQRINDHYEEYCKASERFFDETDNSDVLKEIAEEALSLSNRQNLS